MHILIKVQAIKNTENQNNSEIKRRESTQRNNDGGMGRIKSQEMIPGWVENDPTIIIHA